jgi:cysteine desulfurase
MLVNNETGVIQPVREAARLAKEKGWRVHTDASQALGHLALSFKELGVDMMTLSSHKCGGPVGIGALLLKEDLHIEPLFRGGGQEYGMRSGTLPTALICGFEAAVTEAIERQKDLAKRLGKLQKKIEDSLPEAVVYGKDAARVDHVLSLGMPGVSSDLQLMSFDLEGIAVSAGAACSSGKMKESHVLAAMGIPSSEAQNVIRVSMGWKTENKEIDAFVQAWKNIYITQRLKEAS